MNSENPQHLRLEVGQSIIIEAATPHPGTINPSLLEEVRIVARRSANDAVYALGGGLEDRDRFDGKFGDTVYKLGKRLHEARVPAQVVYEEAFSVYRSEPRNNINPRLAKDLAGFFTDILSYSPKEAA